MAPNKVIRLIIERADGTWGWQLKVGANIIATDGNQGYVDEDECRRMADRVVSGHYKDADKRIKRRDDK